MSATLLLPLVVLLTPPSLARPLSPGHLCLAQNAGVASQAPDMVAGVVRDSAGGSLAGAVVIVRPSVGSEQRGVTGPDGRFSLPSPTAAAEVIVRANGFAESRQVIPAQASHAELVFVLEPAAVSESVTVTATRREQQLGDVPASVNVLSRQDIRRSPAVVADDVLRRIPTFSLFSRMSSIVSHPTAQGVSLRGIGPSGVSRTLVMVDGVPFNDPFGGWVHWSRVPIDSADRVEVVEGASSSLYGNYAMGGVINVIASAPTPRTLELKTQYGSRSTPKLDVRGSDVWGRLGVSFDASLFDTDGYMLVSEDERGLVDDPVNVTFRHANVKVDYDVSDRVAAFGRAGFFREERNNGKHSTINGDAEANDTSWMSVNGGVRLRSPEYGAVQATVFVDVVEFHSNFLAVPTATPPRSFGRMTLNQTVPTKGAGTMVQWSHAPNAQHYLSAGVDWRRVDGDSEEEVLDFARGETVTLRRVSGGTQQLFGFFVQDLFSPVDRLTMTIGARVDRWRNYDGHNLETAVPAGTPGAGHNPSLEERSKMVASPRLAARYRVSDRVSVWGGISQGFRAPTLNELYRGFQIGTVRTLANSALGPERLTAVEGGITVTPTRHILVRTAFYDNRISDPVSNVTQSQNGVNVIQRRENLGKTRVRGVQVDGEYRMGTDWRVTGGYLFNDAKVVESTNVTVVDKFLAQVPQHRGSIEIAYANPRYVNLAVSVFAVGRQFDDDQNIRPVPGYSYAGLPKFATVDLSASRQIGPRLEAFFGIQNLLDQNYYVGTLPTRVGAPRFVTGGLRVSLSGR